MAEAFSTLVVQMLRCDGLLVEAGDRLTRPSGQSSARWRVLAAAGTAPTSVADIARAWNLARQSVQRLADALVGDGLLSYEENPHHRRAKLAVLTPLGRQVLDEIEARQHAWAEEMGARIGAATIADVAAGVGVVLDALSSDAVPED
ncbi:MAG TPA: MarR family transcriptional regulator [Acidimicrobiales bacterium]|nr:MarR family transcriptional regulator [Acidimicrobiales bacterium]